jgi:hypothetical protein
MRRKKKRTRKDGRAKKNRSSPEESAVATSVP